MSKTSAAQVASPAPAASGAPAPGGAPPLPTQTPGTPAPAAPAASPGTAGSAGEPRQSAEGGVAAPAGARGGTAPLSSEEIGALFTFNPFKLEPTLPAAEAGASAPGPAAPPAEPPAAAAAANPEAALLKQQLDQAMLLLQQYQQQPQQPPGAKPPEGQPSGEAIPPYNFTVPPQLMQMMESENPAERQQAIGAVMQGTAQAVHKTLLQEFGKVMQGIPALMQAAIQQHSAAQEVFNDFYGTYKELNRPELRQLVVGVAQQVIQESRATGWSPQLRDAVAGRIFQLLGHKPAQTPPVGAPPIIGGTPARMGSPGRTLADDIKSLL